MSCTGCRVLRKGCSEDCPLRPCLAWIEGQDAQGHATVFLTKFFGRAGLMGFITAVPESQRGALFQSLLYEACGRTINPVYGCLGLLMSGHWALCQAAVDRVLQGGSPVGIQSSDESLTNGCSIQQPNPFTHHRQHLREVGAGLVDIHQLDAGGQHSDGRGKLSILNNGRSVKPVRRQTSCTKSSDDLTCSSPSSSLSPSPSTSPLSTLSRNQANSGQTLSACSNATSSGVPYSSTKRQSNSTKRLRYHLEDEEQLAVAVGRDRRWPDLQQQKHPKSSGNTTSPLLEEGRQLSSDAVIGLDLNFTPTFAASTGASSPQSYGSSYWPLGEPSLLNDRFECAGPSHICSWELDIASNQVHTLLPLLR